MKYAHRYIFGMSLVLCSAASLKAMLGQEKPSVGQVEDREAKVIRLCSTITGLSEEVPPRRAFDSERDRRDAFRVHYLENGETIDDIWIADIYKSFCALFPVHGERHPQWFSPELKYLNKRPVVSLLGLATGAWYLLDKHNEAFREKLSRPALKKAQSLWKSFKKSRPAQVTASVGLIAAALYWAS